MNFNLISKYLVLIFLIFYNIPIFAIKYDANNFDNQSINITNKWFPLKPGTQYIFDGSTIEEGQKVSHKIVMTVTDLTKVINGVNCVVIHEVDLSDGTLKEAELTFYAQDKQGNVWHVGEYSEEYDNEDFLGGKAWSDGYYGARAGIMMYANPKVGLPDYEEGYAPKPYNWHDFGKITKTKQKTTIPIGSYTDVVVINEYNQAEPGFQVKYYAPNVGNIQVKWRGNDKTKESLELVKIIQLEPDELTNIRNQSYDLERRALAYSKTQALKVR